MEEVIDGVFHWKARHPHIESEVDCHFVTGSGTAIDPLLPAEGIEWFDGRGVQRVVLSTRHHLRHAPQLAERFGCPILCHESGLYEFEDGPESTASPSASGSPPMSSRWRWTRSRLTTPLS